MTRPIVPQNPTKKPPKNNGGNGRGGNYGSGSVLNTHRSRGSNKPRRRNPRVGGQGPYKGVPYNQARRLVQLQIQEALNELRREKQGVGRDYQHGVEDANTLYNRSIGDLEHIYKESGDYIGFQNQAIADAFAANKAENAAATQALLGTLSGNTSGVIGGVDAEMARLGITGAANTGGISADGAFAGNLAGINGANEQANIAAMAAGSADVGNLLLGMNAGSRSSHMGQAVNDRNYMLTELLRNRDDNLNDIRQAMRDVRGKKGGMINELLMQLSQTGFDQFIALQQLRLQQQASRKGRGGKKKHRKSSRRSYQSYGGRSNSGGNGGYGAAGDLAAQFLTDTY